MLPQLPTCSRFVTSTENVEPALRGFLQRACVSTVKMIALASSKWRALATENLESQYTAQGCISNYISTGHHPSKLNRNIKGRPLTATL